MAESERDIVIDEHTKWPLRVDLTPELFIDVAEGRAVIDRRGWRSAAELIVNNARRDGEEK